ncbi:hypothetical protein BGZ52_001408 [Haplosporangium bisporale]|nr:hypothetical protein BGZ52_001408 [Haplosporangium bisporale]KAF9212546.1 hypothetical protein BGZ59_006606 [Podila verticillata]
MPSRFEVRGQARAIPLVTVSLASGHLRTRVANMSSNHSVPSHQDQPPSYDTLSVHNQTVDSSTHSQEAQLATASPSNADLTDAVLHLSRTLVSAKSIPPPPTSSWLFMMIYNWTHTQTATRLYHILAKPSTLLKELRSGELLQQPKKQRKSIQQMTEEQDMMEDDPDMTSETATEMMPVSMLNARKVLENDDTTFFESRNSSGEGSMEGLVNENDDGTPRKPKRRIEQYSNPFGPNITDELEDDEGWLGRGETCSEWGETKTNSVRLTSTARLLATANHRRQVDFSTPTSLGAAMDPRQFDMDDTPANTSPSSSFSLSPTMSSSGSSFTSTSESLFNSSTGATFNRPSPAAARARYSATARTLAPSTVIATSAAMSTSLSTPSSSVEQERQSRNSTPSPPREEASDSEDEDEEEQETLVRRPKDSGHHTVKPPTEDSPWTEGLKPDTSAPHLHTLIASTSAALVESRSTAIISSAASITSSSESGAIS